MTKRHHQILTGWRSRGGTATISSPSNIIITPTTTRHTFDVPSSVTSAREAIDLLRRLSIASHYKSRKVTPIYART